MQCVKDSQNNTHLLLVNPYFLLFIQLLGKNPRRGNFVPDMVLQKHAGYEWKVGQDTLPWSVWCVASMEKGSGDKMCWDAGASVTEDGVH